LLNICLIGEGADKVQITWGQAGPAITIGAEIDNTTLIEGLRITAKSTTGDGIFSGSGGSPTIRSCTITQCGRIGISLAGTGGAAAIIQLNEISENLGGAIYIFLDAGSLITNNIIKDNLGGLQDSWQGWQGTVFFHRQGAGETTIFANNLLKNNTSTARTGAAVHVWGGSPTIQNNTIVETSGTPVGHGIGMFTTSSGGSTAPIITSNIIKDNTGSGIAGFANNQTPVIHYNNVVDNAQEDYTVVSDDIGGIRDDPLFADIRNDDYSLQEGSPSIDTGVPGAANTDPDGSRNDMGMFGGPYAQFWTRPYTGPIVTSVEVTPSSVQQGGTITIRATGTTVIE
jgi:hypothetical protein